ncbi:MAG: hypothetical protein AB7G47_11735 [Mycolicibacterium sp.]|uniref:hypothetical protein n=1 Tax=Mycolicibacterium sp. TaxID=2320850 RepID=UPI003D0A1BF5
MAVAIIGSDAVATGILTRGQLRWNYRPLYPNVYIPRKAEPTLAVRTEGAWLWSGRRGVIAGRAASALHGAKWVPQDVPVELLWSNSNPPEGILTRRDRIGPSQIASVQGMCVTTPARTALDLGRYLKRGEAVARLDALAQATGFAADDALALAQHYKGTKGVRRCREALPLMDAGAQSPQETRLRLLLTDRGFPRPETQIPLFDPFGYAFAYLDMGWQDLKIAVEYDGEQHRTNTEQYRWDARRLRRIIALRWIHIRVIAGDRDDEVIARVRSAWQQRQSEAMAVKRPA